MIFLNNKRNLKMFCCFILIIFLFKGLMPVHGANENQDLKSRYQLKEYIDNSKSLKKMQYRIFLPDDYDESIAYPLVVFFGGAGQNITDQVNENDNSNKYIDSSLLANGNDKKYPCIILVPLLPVDYFWVDNYFGEISPGLDLSMGIIDYICNEYSVDQRKIYITGLCFGANGVWDALFRFPQKFAAGVPVANIAPSPMASKAKDIPVWLFCSDVDTNAPIIQTRALVDELIKVGNLKMRYTEYNNYSHIETAKAAFWNNDLFPWMFSQTNPNAPYPDGKTPVVIADENLVMENPSNGQINNEIKDKNSINNTNSNEVQNVTNSLKKSSLQIVIILIGGMICLIVLFLLFYKKILFGHTKRFRKDDSNKTF